jgi:hypothetical protein
MDKRVDTLEATIATRLNEIARQADEHYEANHALILSVYNMHVKP